MIINGKNAWKTWGARLQNGGIEALIKPAPAKAFTTNESRTQAGKQISPKNPQPQAREVSLNISIEGKDFNDYLAKSEAFFAELTKGITELQVSVLAGRKYRLVYRDSNVKMGNYNNGIGVFKIDFEEPNPKDRE